MLNILIIIVINTLSLFTIKKVYIKNNGNNKYKYSPTTIYRHIMKIFTIVSIEDNEPDFELLKQALNTVPDLSIDLINIQNGKNALDFLYKEGEYKTAPTPNLIILDINLPKINGFEILKSIKNDDRLRLIPVIVLSSSESEKDIKDSYELSANTYITKTFDTKELFKKITMVANYWFKTAELPSTSNYSFINKENKPDN
jgi:DNA-binding response OmpR family regulator